MPSNLELDQPVIGADAMLEMDDIVARLDIGKEEFRRDLALLCVRRRAWGLLQPKSSVSVKR